MGHPMQSRPVGRRGAEVRRVAARRAVRPRRAARAVHLVLARLFALGIAAQVFLAGLGVFGAGAGFTAHVALGWWVWLLATPLLVTALVARPPRRVVSMTVALFALTVPQPFLPMAGSAWAGAFHALNAVVLGALAVTLAVPLRRATG